jgi:hypothetical protein
MSSIFKERAELCLNSRHIVVFDLGGYRMPVAKAAPLSVAQANQSGGSECGCTAPRPLIVHGKPQGIQ